MLQEIGSRTSSHTVRDYFRIHENVNSSSSPSSSVLCHVLFRVPILSFPFLSFNLLFYLFAALNFFFLFVNLIFISAEPV
jgi:hypothetical protein